MWFTCTEKMDDAKLVGARAELADDAPERWEDEGMPQRLQRRAQQSRGAGFAAQ
jgi:hypothetical protein